MATNRFARMAESVVKPQKTVHPIASGLLAPAAPSGQSWRDFSGAYGDAGMIGSLSGVHNSARFTKMADEIAARIGFTGQKSTPGTYQFENANEGGTFMETAQGMQASPEFLKALEDYNFRMSGEYEGTISDKAGQDLGTFTAGDKPSRFDEFAQTAIPIALAAMGGAAMGGYIPGVEGVGGAGGAGSTAGGVIGAGEGAAQLAAYTAANPLTAAQVTAAAIPTGGLPGLGAGLSGGLLASVPAESLASLEAYSAANPVTAQTVAATMPQLPAVASAAPAAFNAAADSQLASSQLGITGAQSAAAATAPATVNLGSLGGTMGTAGGLSGALAAGSQIAKDALGPAAAFMKDNPLLGRLLTSGAVSLLAGGAGGGSSGGSQAQAPSGPPVQWNSPLQQGLLAPVQQYAPPAITQNKPAGLLAQGFANDGAWRYLKG